MPNRAQPRAPRVVVAAAISLAVVAAVPALGSAGPSTATGPQTAQVRAPVLDDTSPGATRAEARAGVPQDSAPAATRAEAPKATKPTRPRPVVAKPLSGRAAVKQLGKRLPEVAARTGWSPEKLAHVLEHDDSAYVAKEGRVFYREEAPALPPERAEAVAPAYPTTQTFTLHSRPGATRKIFLDFDGANVSNTGWNGTAQGDVPNGAHTGFSLDGTPSSFTSSEHGYMQEVWREVSETYAPFDIDVTTQDPGLAGIARSSSGDTSFGSHVLVTSDPDPRAALCGSCLGVAWVGTFDNVDPSAYYQPAWVFHYSANFDPMIVAQAASHEAGHTLGLSHDGTATATYFGGTSAWGPIMGSSMNRAVSHWSRGEYTGASNTQDDLAVIQSNGLPLRADDRTTTESLGAQSSYSASGVISTRTDTDSFAINLPCTTTLSVQARGIGRQAALDVSLTVLDGNGATVATSSPASAFAGNPPLSNGMDASATVLNASGNYVLRVDGVGNGNPAAGGWSDYGSLGQYTLTANGCATSTPPVPTPTVPPVGTGLPTPEPAEDPSDPPPAPKVPSAPKMGWVTSGKKGGPKTVTVRWYPPRSTGGAPITSYRIQAQQLSTTKKGRVTRVKRTYRTRAFRASTRAVTITLPAGTFRFQVQAANGVGLSPWSSFSRVVRSR